MQNLFSQLWNDDEGIVALEYLILATILGLGLIVGITALTGALNAEYQELSVAILGLNQSYTTVGFSNCLATHLGSDVRDVQGGIDSANVPGIPVNISSVVCTGVTTPPAP